MQNTLIELGDLVAASQGGVESDAFHALQLLQSLDVVEHTADAVRTATFYPARVSAENADLSNVWEGNDLMAEYSKLIPMLGEYYEDTKGWTQARTSWWNMLQDIGEGADIASTVATFQAEANAAG